MLRSIHHMPCFLIIWFPKTRKVGLHEEQPLEDTPDSKTQRVGEFIALAHLASADSVHCRTVNCREIEESGW